MHASRLRVLHAPLAAVGRMALTSYLGQSVAFNLLFPWYGLALWNRLDRTDFLLVGLAIYVVQVGCAMWWLRRFTMGPCEWVWRWLTYGHRPRLVVAR